MYQYYINSETTVFGQITPDAPITNNVMLDVYTSVMNCIYSQYHTWQQTMWASIIAEEKILDKSCKHKNILYFNIAKDIVWDTILMQLHIPTATIESIYAYYGIDAKALVLQKYGINLHKMLDCTTQYVTPPSTPSVIVGNATVFYTGNLLTSVPATSEEIQAMSNIGDIAEHGTEFQISSAINSLGLVFAYPTILGTNVIVTDVFNTNLISYFDETNVDVMLPNALTPINYTVFSYIPIVPYLGTAIYNIKII
jgi:hypothetical protein